MSINSIEASIKTEAQRNAKLTTDLDNFRNRYIDKDPNSNIEVIYPAFDITTFERNFFMLLQKSERVKFQSRWIMRPDYVSFDKYGTTVYWPLILYMNRIPNIEEFDNFEYILVPPFASIFDLFKDRELEKELISLREPARENIFVNQFYKNYPLDKNELDRLKAQNELLSLTQQESLAVYNATKSETRVLTAEDISLKYIDLQYVPANESSLTLKLNNLPILQRYNYDYTLKFTSFTTDRKRISWKPSDVLENSDVSAIISSMNNYIKVGDTLNIKYQVSIVYRISDGVPSI